MGASLIFGLLKKGAPYIIIGILGVYAYIAHLRLVDCQAHMQMAVLANHQMEQGILSQNKAISKEWKETQFLQTQMDAQNLQLASRIRKTKEKVRKILAHPYIGSCSGAIDSFVKETRGIK